MIINDSNDKFAVHDDCEGEPRQCECNWANGCDSLDIAGVLTMPDGTTLALCDFCLHEGGHETATNDQYIVEKEEQR